MIDSSVGSVNFPSCFVTGTDTDAGKTVASASLLRYLAANDVSSAGIKPIASGFEQIDGVWVNQDIQSLKSASKVSLPDELINNYAFKPAIAPHIAAADEGVQLSFDSIANSVRNANKLVDTLVVEGVGGWVVPLAQCDVRCASPCLTHANVNIAALAVQLNLPVVLVVGLRLGCLNHALLTANAILAEGLNLLGWVASGVSPDFARKDENMDCLKKLMPAPLLFEIPFLTSRSEIDSFRPQSVQI